MATHISIDTKFKDILCLVHQYFHEDIKNISITEILNVWELFIRDTCKFDELEKQAEKDANRSKQRESKNAFKVNYNLYVIYLIKT